MVEANQGHVERYVRHHTRLPDIHYAAQGRLCKAALSVPFIATVLREQGILSGSAPVSNADAWLARFENHLMRVHGLAPESRHHYLRYARRLIQSLQMIVDLRPKIRRLTAVVLAVTRTSREGLLLVQLIFRDRVP